MTNYQIIENAKNELGLDEDLILKTYQDWKRLGYQVKKLVENFEKSKTLK